MIDLSPEEITRVLYNPSDQPVEVVESDRICGPDGEPVGPWMPFGIAARGLKLNLVNRNLRVHLDIIGESAPLFSVRGSQFQIAMVQIFNAEIRINYGTGRLILATFDHILHGEYRAVVTFSFRDGLRFTSRAFT